ncbi:uncharacterized protein [Prorops nasuta]|uniref:uncharacterized protein n=1 Tax=Prorops nasuta TaxID=863751 RepID=UPI0034CEF512
MAESTGRKRSTGSGDSDEFAEPTAIDASQANLEKKISSLDERMEKLEGSFQDFISQVQQGFDKLLKNKTVPDESAVAAASATEKRARGRPRKTAAALPASTNQGQFLLTVTRPSDDPESQLTSDDASAEIFQGAYRTRILKGKPGKATGQGDDSAFRPSLKYRPPAGPEESLVPELAYTGSHGRSREARRHGVHALEVDKTSSSDTDESTTEDSNDNEEHLKTFKSTRNRQGTSSKSKPSLDKAAGNNNSRQGSKRKQPGPSATCFNCGNAGHGWSACKEQRTMFCYRCGSKGVSTAECPKCCSKNAKRSS